MTHNAGGSTSSAEPCPWGHCYCSQDTGRTPACCRCGAKQARGLELNPCDFCGDPLRLFFLPGGDRRVRVQHGDNPEHSQEYGSEFGVTTGYLPFITSIHERDERAAL